MTEQNKTTTIPLPVPGKDMDSIMQSLESGVEELFTSNRYQEFLKTMAKFHNYSFNNTMLIAMQRPDATLVTSYKNWQSMGRQVMKGEKGITIIAPAPYKKMKEKEVLDENQRPIMGSDGKPKTEQVEVTVPHFKAVTVFDIAQTSGEPIQTLAPELLTAAVQDFDSFMQAIQKISPVPIRFDEIDGNANGYYHNADKEIVIKKGLSESQTLKTAIHETVHAKLHDREIMESLGVEKDRLTKEVEAESVAYCVCSSFGLPPSEKAFAYKMKMDAMKRQGARNDIADSTYTQNGWRSETAAVIGQQVGESKNQVRRYIRLTELIPDLLDYVDKKRLQFTVAVDISYIDKEIQTWLFEYIKENGTVKAVQVAALRTALEAGPMTQAKMISILVNSQPGRKQEQKITLSEKKLRNFFSDKYTAEDMESVILELLDQWKRGEITV